MDENETVEPVKRRPGRPKRVSLAQPSLIDEKFNQLLEVLAAKGQAQTGGIDMDALAAVLNANSKTMQKTLHPENEFHPEKSALSYPEGDRARPRPVLPYELFWNGYPMHMFPETEHWRELELACELQPGEFTVLRKDGTRMNVSVVAERDADNKVTKLLVTFPVSREDKWLVPPKVVVLYQLVHPDNPKVRFMEAMNEYLQVMFTSAA